jgi:hypothetical protein
MMTKNMFGFALLAAAVSLATVANAQTLLIDLGNTNSFRGAGINGEVDENGNTWNSVWAGAYYANLTAMDGGATAIGFGFVFAGGADSYNGPAGATDAHPATIANCTFNPSVLGVLGATNAVYDFYVSQATNKSVVVFESLESTNYYKLNFFGSHKYNNDDVTVYSVTESNGVEIASASLTVGSGGSHNEDHTVSINNIVPDEDNKIWVTWVGENGNAGYLNGMALEVQDEFEPPVEEGGETNVFLVDFGTTATYRGLSVQNLDENGNYWNLRGYGDVPNMWTADNTASTIDLIGPVGFGTDSYNGPAGATDVATLDTDVTNTVFDAAALGDLGITNAVFDFFTGVGLTFELQDLDPTRKYDLVFFGSRKYGESDLITTYSVTDSNGLVITSADLTIGDGDFNHNTNSVAVISGASPDAVNKIYVTFVGKFGGSGVLNAMKIISYSGLSGYESWSNDYALVEGQYGDDDTDGVLNIYEYGQGGDPTNGTVSPAVLPVYSVSGGTMEYIHTQRAGDDAISYYLELTDTLTPTAWTNDGYVVSGTNVTGGTVDYVTNQIPTTDPEKFIQFIIEQ